VRHDSTHPDSPFQPGQEDNDFSPVTAPLPGETVIAKRVTSAFIGRDLEPGFKRWEETEPRRCSSSAVGCSPIL
jgi:hypothetical protein